MKNIITILLFCSVSILAQGVKKPDGKLQAYKLSESFSVDGVLNESVYQNKPISEFTQKDPVQGSPASELTHVWISYDESNLYIGARMFDSNPDSIDNSLMRRDNIVDSDWFWVYLDTYNDDRTGFYFAVNAGGSICDGTLYNDGWMGRSWDGIWETETIIDDKGWIAEMKIPFSQLRFNEAEEMTWGININRDIKRKHEMSFVVMIPKEESGFCSHFIDLEGLNGIKAPQRFEIMPYIVQKAQYLNDMEDDPFYKSNQYKTTVGADLKFSLGSNLNVDATFNPDFGQVEVDPAVVNLSAFENFFSEKRPFFIEGANIFRFGSGGANNNWGFNFGNPTLFYSRRIGRSPQGGTTIDGAVDRPSETRILGAAKITGKVGEGWSVGALTAFTERTYARIQNDEGRFEQEVEPLTHYGVFRARKEFNEGNQALGIIATSVNRDLQNPNLKDRLSENAFTFGLDGWTFLDNDKMYVLTGSLAGSYVHGTKDYLTRLQSRPYRYLQRPDRTYMPIDTTRTSLTGAFSRIMLNKQKGNFYINAALGTATPGFEHNDFGSQWFADRINGHIVLGYRWYEPDGLFRRKSFNVAFNRNSDYEDNISRQGFYATSNFQFENYWNVYLSSGLNLEGLTPTLTRGGPLMVSPRNGSINLGVSTDSREKIVLEPNGSYWTNDIGSYSYSYGLEIEWKPIPQIDFSIEPEYSKALSNAQWVTNYADDAAINTFNNRYVFATLDQTTVSADIRLNWTFTPKLSLQLYVQPFFAVGDYDGFKSLASPSTIDFNNYEENYNSAKDEYYLDADGAGPAATDTLSNRDFNFKSLRGNLVLRYEVLPGSVFYFVWTRESLNFQHPGDHRLGRDFKNLLKEEADNIFLIKFSYWINM